MLNPLFVMAVASVTYALSVAAVQTVYSARVGPTGRLLDLGDRHRRGADHPPGPSAFTVERDRRGSLARPVLEMTPAFDGLFLVYMIWVGMLHSAIRSLGWLADRAGLAFLQLATTRSRHPTQPDPVPVQLLEKRWSASDATKAPILLRFGALVIGAVDCFVALAYAQSWFGGLVRDLVKWLPLPEPRSVSLIVLLIGATVLVQFLFSLFKRSLQEFFVQAGFFVALLALIAVLACFGALFGWGMSETGVGANAWIRPSKNLALVVVGIVALPLLAFMMLTLVVAVWDDVKSLRAKTPSLIDRILPPRPASFAEMRELFPRASARNRLELLKWLRRQSELEMPQASLDKLIVLKPLIHVEEDRVASFYYSWFDELYESIRQERRG